MKLSVDVPATQLLRATSPDPLLDVETSRTAGGFEGERPRHVRAVTLAPDRGAQDDYVIVRDRFPVSSPRPLGAIQVILQTLTITLIMLLTALFAVLVSAISLVAWVGLFVLNGLRRWTGRSDPPPLPPTNSDTTYSYSGGRREDWG